MKVVFFLSVITLIAVTFIQYNPDSEEPKVAPTVSTFERSIAGKARIETSDRQSIVAASKVRKELNFLTEQIYALRDNQLVPHLSTILFSVDADEANEILPMVYEETQLRPDYIRQPLMLELARHPHVKEDLRNTILSELGALLETDHGSSWADWSLALHEHLAEHSGFIRQE